MLPSSTIQWNGGSSAGWAGRQTPHDTFGPHSGAVKTYLPSAIIGTALTAAAIAFGAVTAHATAPNAPETTVVHTAIADSPNR